MSEQAAVGVPECGTYARYQRHLKAGEIPDAECRAAGAAYMARYRAERTERQIADSRYSGACWTRS